MSNSSNSPVAEAGAHLARLVPEPPAWATQLASGSDHEAWRLVSARIPDAGILDAAGLEAAVTEAYGSLAATLARTGHHPVRFWNFVPGIHADMGDGLDRYMVFNAGRFTAFCSWFGSAAVFSRTVPTASAVGVVDGPLVIHGLAARDPGRPIENPRQVPAYSYSTRYGPLPPCFARATVVPMPEDPEPGASGSADTPSRAGGARLFVGGTASIVGEDSRHLCDARQQTLETFANLAHLIAAAGMRGGEVDEKARLDAFTDVRVYIVRESDAAVVRPLVLERLAPAARVEFAQADLCRRELLVEIEGVASV